jgi:hypothetical protein
MKKLRTLSRATRTGIYVTSIYVGLILFLALLSFIGALLGTDSFWLLVPLGFMTEFPFVPLILAAVVLITGNEELMLIPVRHSSFPFMVIGAVMNAIALFIAGYLASRIFSKKRMQ